MEKYEQVWLSAGAQKFQNKYISLLVHTHQPFFQIPVFPEEGPDIDLQ